MKKSIFNLALLSMLFVLGACSTTGTDTDGGTGGDTGGGASDTVFLDTIKTKNTFEFEKKIGKFSSDGRTFDVDPSFSTLGVSGTLTFKSAASSTEATYKDTTDKSIIITLTGDTGGNIDVNFEKTFFKYVSMEHPDIKRFLDKVKTKNAFEFENKIGTFSIDGRTFDVDPSFSTLGVSGTLTFNSASSSDIAVYTDTSSPEKEVTIDIRLSTSGFDGRIKVGTKKTDFTYESKVDPNKEAFINNVKNSTLRLRTVPNTTIPKVVASFDEDGKMTVKINNVDKLATLTIATSDELATYTVDGDATQVVVTYKNSSDITIKIDNDSPQNGALFFNKDSSRFPSIISSIKGKTIKTYSSSITIGTFSADGLTLTGTLVTDVAPSKTAHFLGAKSAGFSVGNFVYTITADNGTVTEVYVIDKFKIIVGSGPVQDVVIE